MSRKGFHVCMIGGLGYDNVSCNCTHFAKQLVRSGWSGDDKPTGMLANWSGFGDDNVPYTAAHVGCDATGVCVCGGG